MLGLGLISKRQRVTGFLLNTTFENEMKALSGRKHLTVSMRGLGYSALAHCYPFVPVPVCSFSMALNQTGIFCSIFLEIMWLLFFFTAVLLRWPVSCV